MRLITLLLTVLILGLQWPMWFSKGGWYSVWQIERQLRQQRKNNEKLIARNTALAAEVYDLKNGMAAIEELARNELGMIKENEIFFQVLEKNDS